MNKKLINIIFAILILAIVGAIVYWYWQSQQQNLIIKQPPVDTVVNDINNDLSLPDINEPETNNEPTFQPPTVPINVQLTSVAYYFVERFGTYSNVSDFNNIEDVKSVMAPDFYNQIMSQRRELSFAEQTSTDYDGYDAKVVKIDWLDETGSSAEARITTRRHHFTNDTEEPFSQDIIVRFQNINDEWLVTEAVWQ